MTTQITDENIKIDFKKYTAWLTCWVIIKLAAN